MKPLRRPARLQGSHLWLYAAIVAIALKDALSVSLPYLFSKPPSEYSATLPQVSEFLMLMRLTTFTALIVRYYLGSTIFFETVYYGSEAHRVYFRKNYSMDFIYGFFQFIFFLVLAECIDPVKYPSFAFPVVIAAVLGYDVLWLFSSIRLDTFRLIRFSVFINLMNLMLAMSVYIIVLRATNSSVSAESLALAIVLFFSLFDLGQMMARRNLLSVWVQRPYDQDLQ